MSGKHISDKSPEDDNLAKDIPISPELIEAVPEEKRKELIQQISEYSLHVEHIVSSPLPPPKMIKEYQEAVPGSGELIIDSFVQQQKHRRMLEDRGQKEFIKRDMLSLWFAFILALVMILGFIIVILSGRSVEGLLGMGGTVATVAGAFLYNQHSSRKERQEREALTKSASPPELPDSGSEAGK